MWTGLSYVDKRFQSIVEELLDYAPQRDKDAFIEGRGLMLISSATHLIRHIKESYDPAIADDLVKRLIRSIVTEDEEKFRRGVKNIRDAKAKKNNNEI